MMVPKKHDRKNTCVLWYENHLKASKPFSKVGKRNVLDKDLEDLNVSRFWGIGQGFSWMSTEEFKLTPQFIHSGVSRWWWLESQWDIKGY